MFDLLKNLFGKDIQEIEELELTKWTIPIII